MSTIKSIRPEPEGVVVEQPQARYLSSADRASVNSWTVRICWRYLHGGGAHGALVRHGSNQPGSFPLRGVLRRTGTVSGRHVVVQGARRSPTAMHGMWGAFWMAYGLLMVMVSAGKVVIPPNGGAFPALGFWFIVLAAITWAGMAAASAESSVVATVLGFLAAGSTIAAIANLGGIEGLSVLAGYLFIISAVIAWYAATALMVNAVYGRVVMGLGSKRREVAGIQAGIGEPGVLHGQ